MNAEMLGAAASTVAHAADDVAKRTITLADVEVLDQLVANLPKVQQLAIGRQMLDDPRVLTSPLVKGPLAAIRSGLEDVTSQDVRITTVLGNVRTTITQELDRMAGKIQPAVQVNGKFVPDNAAIGSIRDNLKLLGLFQVI